MTRDISAAAANDLRAQGSPHALLGFLTLRHRNLSEPVRIVSDPVDFTVDGKTYLGCPFEFQPLTDEDSAPVTQVRLQNVDRRIGAAIRQVTDRATVTLEARSTADFDLSVIPRTEIGTSAVLYGFRHFDLIDVTVTALDIVGTLALRNFAQEPWPGKRATQMRCPALFR